jgi:transposase-like protein
MDEIEIITCPACDAQQDEAECFLGQLGWLSHYRCRYCGWTFSESPLSRSIEEAGK